MPIKSFRRPLICMPLALLIVSLFLSTAAFSQTTDGSPVRDEQALAVIAQAHAALGNVQVSDLTLTGSATWLADGTEQTGQAILKIRGTAESRIDLSGSTSRSEIRNDTSFPAGQWIGSDGKRHWMPPHNCWVPAGVLLPHALLQTAITDSDASLRYIAQETRKSSTVDHVQFSRTFKFQAPLVNALATRLSRAEFYFDANSHLLVAVAFTQQLDNDADRSFPSEIQFSNYQNVNGILIPFQISRHIGSLSLQFTATDASLNSGLQDSDFALQ